MEYPKKVMRKTELEEMGIAKAYLMRIYLEYGAPVAYKLNPHSKRKNSPIVFDTEELAKIQARGM